MTPTPSDSIPPELVALLEAYALAAVHAAEASTAPQTPKWDVERDAALDRLHAARAALDARLAAVCADAKLIDAMVWREVTVRQMVGGGFSFENEDGDWDGRRYPSWREAATAGVAFHSGLPVPAAAPPIVAEPPQQEQDQG